MNLNITYVLVFLFPLSSYSSYKVFFSYREQSRLLYEFNTSNYSNSPIEITESYNTTYPEISGTCIPLRSFIGIKKLELDDVDGAVRDLRQALNVNPYLGITETYLAEAYLRKKMIDSAYFFGKIAMEKQPSNIVTYAYYMKVLYELKDTITMRKVYENVKNKDSDKRFSRLMYLASANLMDKDESRFILNDIELSSLDRKDDDMMLSYYTLALGKSKVAQAHENYLIAEELFANKNFSEAASYYEKAFELNKYEIIYRINQITSLMKGPDENRAVELLHQTIELAEFNPKAYPKIFYLLAVIYMDTDSKKSCEYLNKAINYGFTSAIPLKKSLCGY